MAKATRTAAIRRNRLALAVAAALMPFTNGAQADPAANALPTGGQVTAGTATISQPSTNALQINQASDKAILQWQTFSIGSAASVNFTQPSASSIALNRVLGSNPSEIFGHLTANGQVFLSNPSGVLFGPSASVDVGALFATTLSITDSDFLAGNYNFSNAGGAGSVVNQGSITAGGYAALAGPQVRNDGIIVANSGTVALAAGDRVSLDMVGDGLISVSVDQAAMNASAINAGTLQADGGKVVLTARSANALLDTVVNNTGIIRANSLVSRNGEIVLDGGSAGTVANSGALQGTGANVSITGDNVTVDLGSAIDGSASIVALNAASDITVNAPITLSSGVLMANAGHDMAVDAFVSSRNMNVSVGNALSLNAAGTRDAFLSATGGQNISSGSLSLNAQDARRAVVQNTTGDQTVTVGAGGIDLSVLNGQGVAQIVSARPSQSVFTNGAQTVQTTGTLNVVGGSSSLGGVNSGVFQNQTGKQTVTAGSIFLQGATAPVNTGGAFISNTGGGPSSDQEISVASGTIALTGGGIGLGNRAGITTSGNQTINGNADIVVTGGASGAGLNSNNTNNAALISANGSGKTQTISAHNITLNAGSGGTDTFAVITSNSQRITATGDVHITGGANSGDSNGARIGAPGNTTVGTNLELSARDIVLTGGATSSGAAIGSSANSGSVPNTIKITASGDVVLDSGAGNGSRIGAPNGSSGGGDIEIDAVNIALNGGAHQTVIRTTGTVKLNASGSISEGPNGAVLANTLDAVAAGMANLAGANQVSVFNGTSGGAMTFTNSGPLSITGISAGGTLSLWNSGALSLSAGGGQDALVSSVGGQMISADSISLVAQDGRRALLFNASGDQTVTATAGNIDLIAVGGAGTAKVVNGSLGGGAFGSQAVSASGALTVVGGAAAGTGPQYLNSGVFENASGLQTVHAASITLQGSDLGNNGGAFISNANGGGDQMIDVTGGAITITGGGSTGFGNRAAIQSIGNQTISGNPDIVVTGGASGTGSVTNGTSNAAIISTGGAGKVQTIDAASITLNAGAAGTDTFAVITAPTQVITATGDVVVNGGGASGTGNGARIGGVGSAGTNLTLGAHNVVLNGGSVSGAGLGSSPIGAALPNNITVQATGDVILNSGSGGGVRIGSTPANGIAGGNIAIGAGGNIALNGTAQAAAIRTTGDVTLQAGGAISETGNGLVQATSLTTTSGGSTLLGGPNSVSSFVASAGGDVLLNNTSAVLSLGSMSLPASLTVHQAGDLLVGDAGALTPTMVLSWGAMSLTSGGAMIVRGSDSAANAAAVVLAGGPLDIQAGSLSLLAGASPYASSVVMGRSVNVSTAGDLALAGGSGDYSQALLLSCSNINLTVGGLLTINRGSGEDSYARIQAAQNGVINLYFPNLSSGGYTVDGFASTSHGSDGLFTGSKPAKLGSTLLLKYGF